ncbi:unnamed protein product, partial [Mesorhabditis belari]|uniref:Seven TM Receptor n=1 Tax=Mesorhabditis belari TaxID=2138241 RepID=A0AAF3ELV4_9BILA
MYTNAKIHLIECGTWTLNTHIALQPDDEIFNYTNERYKNLTGRDVIGTGSLAQAFEGVSNRVIIRSYIGMMVFSVILSFNWASIIYCGWSLNKALSGSGKSTKTRNMQKELFKALIFQLIVPLISVYSPMSFFFMSAIVGFEKWNTEVICIMLMLDPILEPLVIMYFIKCYRRPLVRFICCGKRQIFGFRTTLSNPPRYNADDDGGGGGGNNRQIGPQIASSTQGQTIQESFQY